MLKPKELTHMGKGDIKTKRGKITNKSFGKKRPHQVKNTPKTEKVEADSK